MSRDIYDLFYCEDPDLYLETKKALLEAFPAGRCESASDDVHSWRLAFAHPDIDMSAYLRQVLCSLCATLLFIHRIIEETENHGQ